MVGVKSIWIRCRFFIATAIVLFASFAFNLFGVGDSEKWFFEFQKDSSFLVEKSAACKNQQSYYSGMLAQREPGRSNPDSCAENDNIPYVSQYGLQSRAIRLFAPSDSSQLTRYFGAVELLLALSAALVMTAIVFRTRRLYGKITAIFLLAAVCFSPWIVAYARNLYWVLPLMIAPFALVYCCYPWFIKKNLKWVMYAGLFVLLSLKLLNGYEHVITVIVSVMAALTLYEYKNFRDSWKRLLGDFVLVGLIGVVAFVSAFIVNIIGLNEYYRTSDSSISEIRSRAGERGFVGLKELQPYVLFGLERTLPDVYITMDYYGNISAFKDGSGNPISYAALSVLNYSLLPAVNYPVRGLGLFWTILQSIGLIAVVGFIADRKLMRLQKKKRDNKDNSLRAAMFVSLLGAIGWLVLMPGHTYPHAHLNAIVFYLPFLLFCYIAIGRYLSILAERIRFYVSAR